MVTDSESTNWAENMELPNSGGPQVAPALTTGQALAQVQQVEGTIR